MIELPLERLIGINGHRQSSVFFKSYEKGLFEFMVDFHPAHVSGFPIKELEPFAGQYHFQITLEQLGDMRIVTRGQSIKPFEAWITEAYKNDRITFKSYKSLKEADIYD